MTPELEARAFGDEANLYVVAGSVSATVLAELGVAGDTTTARLQYLHALGFGGTLGRGAGRCRLGSVHASYSFSYRRMPLQL